MLIGVDVGGTNTDAVLMDGRRVLSAVKKPTAANIGDGVIDAVAAVLGEADRRPDEIANVMIGTTQFTNAFVEGHRLVEVAVVRAALPATRSVRPLIDFPAALSQRIGQHVYLVGGGYEFDGRELAPLDEAAVADAARDIRRKGIGSAAVSCVFAPINACMERRIEEILRNEAPDLHVTLSSEIGRVGLIERENAAIINASLADLSVRVVSAFKRALAELGIDAPFHISQNDGTLMAAEHVERYPVLTFASGPTNSMRGAAYLSGKPDAVVVDIGGTTTDVGVLVGGFPRESAISVDIGGVRTNFRMPDILAIGLGGGSRVRGNEDVTIGPDSVGYRLVEKALVFGGDTLTATDIAVAAGYADIGDRDQVRSLGRDLVDRTVERIHAIVEDAIDRVKTSAENVPVILVGGGSVLVNRDLKGASEVVMPERFDVANAIGAGLAQVGGEVDRIYAYDEIGRRNALEIARRDACARAVDAGADEDSVQIVDIEELPLTYMPAGAVRVKAKAVGNLRAQ